MNTKRSVLVVLLLVVVMAFFGFQKYSAKKETSVPVNTDQGLSVVKETDTSNKYWNVSYEYPKVGVGASTVEARVKSIVSEWKSENDLSKLSDEDLEMAGLTEGRKYELTIKYSKTDGAKLTTHEIEAYSFTGGAHGITTIETLSFTSDGTQVSLSDLFVNDQSRGKLREKLKIVLYKDFAERLYTEPKMVEDGLSGEALDSMQFEATKTGLTFIFSQYQVGPYVSGIIKVPLTAAELSGIVKPELI
jgi:hypothetical protein